VLFNQAFRTFVQEEILYSPKSHSKLIISSWSFGNCSTFLSLSFSFRLFLRSLHMYILKLNYLSRWIAAEYYLGKHSATIHVDFKEQLLIVPRTLLKRSFSGPSSHADHHNYRKRTTCMKSMRFFFMVNMARSIDRGLVRPATTSYNMATLPLQRTCLILDINVMINWHRSKQSICWPVSSDHIVGSGLKRTWFLNLLVLDWIRSSNQVNLL